MPAERKYNANGSLSASGTLLRYPFILFKNRLESSTCNFGPEPLPAPPCPVLPQIARHRSGRSAGFAIVTFTDFTHARAALQALDNATLFGRRLNVRWYQPDTDGPKNPNDVPAKLGPVGLPLPDAGFGNWSGLMAPVVPQQERADLNDVYQLGQPQCAAGQPAWSTLVNLWLNDYTDQVCVGGSKGKAGQTSSGDRMIAREMDLPTLLVAQGYAPHPASARLASDPLPTSPACSTSWTL